MCLSLNSYGDNTEVKVWLVGVNAAARASTIVPSENKGPIGFPHRPFHKMHPGCADLPQYVTICRILQLSAYNKISNLLIS
jgi:hypothetical protein